MRIGYCSPFNPMKSGISDFSEELIWPLKEQMDVVLFTPVKLENKKISAAFECHPLSDLDKAEVRGSLDLIVYQVGNHLPNHGAIVEMMEKYPGILELHDLALHHFVFDKLLAGGSEAGKQAYLEKVEYCHGAWGVQAVQPYFEGKSGYPCEIYGLEMTMNRHIVDLATGVIVHSDLAKQMLLPMHPGLPITVIPLHSPLGPQNMAAYQRQCRKALGLPEGKLIFGSFGLATADKRILQTLDAIHQLKDTLHEDFLYLVVGEVNPRLEIHKKIEELQLEKHVKITGFVSLDDFGKYIGACDFCMNLRYPTRGESSAALHRMLGMGKPVVATAVGTFLEYPEDIVRKVRYDDHEQEDILAQIAELASDRKRLAQLSQEARRYAQEHFSLEKNAPRYAEFFKQVLTHTYHGSWMDSLVDTLMELGLTDEQYTEHLCEIIGPCDMPQ